MIYWINNNSDKYNTEQFNKCPELCERHTFPELQSSLSTPQWKSQHCFKYNHAHLKHWNYMEIHAEAAYCSSPLKATVTWHQASEICNSAGIKLPVFRSRDELSEFLALLKLSPYKTVRSDKEGFSRYLKAFSPEDSPLMNYAHMEELHISTVITKIQSRKGEKLTTASPEQFQIVFVGLKTKTEQVRTVCVSL